MIWKSISNCQHSDGKIGDWTLSMSPSDRESCRISLRLAPPEGHTWGTIWDMTRTMDDDETMKWWKYLSPTEIGSASNMFEAKKLISMFEHHPIEDDPAHLLLSTGFNFDHRVNNDTDVYSYKRASSYMQIMLANEPHHQRIWTTFQGPRGKGWWNLLILHGNQLNYNRTEIIDGVLPYNFINVGVAHSIWILKNRDARGGDGRAFKKPLEQEYC